MKLYDVGIFGFRAVAARLTESAYGHQVEDIAMSALLARRLGRPLVLIPPREIANRAIVQVRSPDARNLGIRASRLVTSAVRCSEGTRRAPDRLAKRLVNPTTTFGLGVDIRRELSYVSLTYRLPEDIESAARIEAAAVGIDVARPIACLHARHSGFKEQSAESAGDRARNADIHTYGPAASLLAGAGFQVVRVGDNRSPSFVHPDVVDLATHEARTDALEVFVCLSATVFVTGDSGVSRVAFLSSAPLLTVNAVNLVGAYPLRPTDRILPKRVIERETGDELSLDELLRSARDIRTEPERYRIVDNTADEILAAVAEMIDLLRGETIRSEAQERFHGVAEHHWANPDLVRKRERKGLPAHEFLGRGAIARVAVQGPSRSVGSRATPARDSS